jgi:hypothetical protein
MSSLSSLHDVNTHQFEVLLVVEELALLVEQEAMMTVPLMMMMTNLAQC